MKKHLPLFVMALLPAVTATAASSELVEENDLLNAPIPAESTAVESIVATAATPSEPTFKFTPAGRVLMDAAMYAPDGDGFADGAALPDIRIGGKASYGDWSAKLDIGFGYSKLSLKDVYMQYSFPGTNNLIRAGYFVHQFGLNAATSSSFKPTGEAPLSDNFFNATGRNLGVMFVLDRPQFFMGVSGIVAGTSINTPSNEQGKVSAGVLGRFVWRPLAETGKVVQIGVSPWYETPFHKSTSTGDGHSTVGSPYFNFSTNFPTRVAQVKALGTGNIDDARGLVKLTPELVLSYSRFALEGQYYWMNVARKGEYHHYSAQGVYGLLRGLICGDSEYSYSHGDAGLAIPKPKTLEVVLGYNYTDGNKNGIYGGITNNYSVTFNYYINKYMMARLGWSYNDVRNSSVMFDRHVNIIQARLQFKF